MRSLPVTLQALGARTGLRRVLAAYFLFDFIEFAAWLAVILFCYERGGPGLAGLAAVVQLVPAAILAPMLASVGDSMPRGRALVLVHGCVATACGLTLVALAVGAPVVVVLVASTAVTTTLATVRPVHFASLPQLASTPEELVSANVLSSVADGLMRFVGPVVTGFAVALYGAWIVLLATMLCGLAASILCIGLGLAGPSPDDEPEGWLSALEGLVALRGDWGSLALLLVLTVDFLIAGALDVLGVSFSTSVLGGGTQGAGLIIGAMGIGGLVGAFGSASFARRRILAPIITGGAILEAVAVIAVAQLSSLPSVMVALAVGGMGGALTMVTGRTLLQRATDNRILTRVFAVQESTTLLGAATGAILAPVAITRLSPAAAFVPFGIGAALIGLVGLVLIRRLDARAVVHPLETALLRGVPFLGLLPQYELERLAANSRWLDVTAGAVVVRQGEPGTEFYVVGEGTFDVDIDGAARPRLTAGEGFGEIALLHSVPRTATVIAATAGRLLVVRSEDFLAAVTGSEDGHALAREIASSRVARDRV
jgi:MFS family permease